MKANPRPARFDIAAARDALARPPVPDRDPAAVTPCPECGAPVVTAWGRVVDAAGPNEFFAHPCAYPITRGTGGIRPLDGCGRQMGLFAPVPAAGDRLPLAASGLG